LAKRSVAATKLLVIGSMRARGGEGLAAVAAKEPYDPAFTL
jgi:hypothetical protein